MMAALAAQYAAIRDQLKSTSTVTSKRQRHTSCGPCHYTKLACNIDNGSSVSRSTIMSRKWLLLDHVLEFLSRAHPTTPIIDLIDGVEFIKTHLVRPLTRAEYPSCIDGIVDSTEAGDCSFEHILDVLGLRDVCSAEFYLDVGGDGVDEALCLLESGGREVCYEDSFAAFTGK